MCVELNRLAGQNTRETVVDAKNQTEASIWMDGNFVAFEDAAIHPLSNSVQYGMGVFEGLRCYSVDDRAAIFRLHDHTNRLFESAHILDIQIPFTKAAINEAIMDTVRKNKMKSGYIRPMVYLGWEYFGLHAQNLTVHVMIATLRMGEYLRTAMPDAGLKLRTSSFQRIHPSSLMAKAKACGHYVNSVLAYREARSSNCDDAIMLDSNGCIAEASSSNIFIIKNGIVYTPTDVSILLGLTRDTVLHICEDLKLKVVTKQMTRDEAYTADEIFVAGTAAELKAVSEYDNRKIGSGLRGPVTKSVQDAFHNIVSGNDARHANWLTKV
jgi:branched-chain amino acid aminotransferase